VDSEGWYGLTVRTHEGAVLGVVVGVFAQGPLAGRLCVQGDDTSLGRKRGSRDGITIYAIPRSAVVRRRRDSLVLGAPQSRARGTWLMHVLQAKQASWTFDVVRGPADEATRARQGEHTLGVGRRDRGASSVLLA
jgi:hypothetical protein